MEGARKRMKQAQGRYKRDYDRRMKQANTEIAAGDSVYLNPEGSKQKGKLGAHALGPYTVLDRTERTLVIKRDELVERVNSDRATKAPKPAGATRNPGTARAPTGEEDIADATPTDLRAKNYEGKTWLVEGIQMHRTLPGGSAEFLIKWDGHDTPTWEPRTNIPEELISRYLRKKGSEDREQAGKIRQTVDEE